MKYLLLSFILVLSLESKAQIFTQDFGSSALVTAYVSATPSANQFNSIGTSGSSTTVAISSGKLVFNRGTTNTGSFSRTTDLLVNNLIAMKFDLEVSGNSVAQTTAATFQFGTGFGTANSTESNADVHSRIGVNFSATDGSFSLRDIGASTNSAVFTGTQTVTWVINNTNSAQSYTAPNGATESIAVDKADVWVGTSKAIDEIAATTSTQSLTDFKFVFSAGTSIVSIDNIIINEYTVLPVTLTSFAAKSLSDVVQLTWSTGSEINSKYFEVLKSTDGTDFNSIGIVDASGRADTYSFADPSLLSGTVYYKLKQVDINGQSTISKPIVVSNTKLSSFDLRAIHDSSVDFVISSSNNTSGKIVITDIIGKTVVLNELILKTGINTVNIPLSSSESVLIATYISSNGTKEVLKFYK